MGYITICAWSNENEDYNTWQTDCGNLWQIIDGTPKDNKMRFCPYCGRPIMELEMVKDGTS
ncbi:hypothetical protein LCGC14_0923070 [marine sediment metagenome]|uniref:Uncharacterized protein n=1 Tax=marine sediment metagenome TaxID=412755 RepID=A0A0F9NV08_9ZZZZ